MNKYEIACKEWLKSCTCAGMYEPYECKDCTKGFYNRIKHLAEDEGYTEIGVNAIDNIIEKG